MASWAQKRKFLYGGVTFVIVVCALCVPVFLYFYQAPTCSDGIMNGSETGVDCGGACQKLCQTSFLSPVVRWTRFEKVATGLYNVGSYLINPNPSAQATNAPYRISLFDDKGILITSYQGMVTLPPHRNTIAFKAAVNVGTRTPAQAIFEWTQAPQWVPRSDALSSIQIGTKTYSEDGPGSSLQVDLKNMSAVSIGPVSVYAVLYDKDANVLGFSKTIVDSIDARSSATAPFTWPISHDNRVISVEVLPVVQ